VALERQSIEKKDFPIGRRGYDPEAVDLHLHALADEIEELKRSSRRRSETLASAASDQVRAIVEAAEASAAAIRRQAEEEAQEIRAEATGEAHATRENATAQAREYIGKVSESTAAMLQRLDAMESELGSLIESLRTGSNRLSADLQLLEGNLSEVSEAVVPRPRFEAEPAAEQKLTGPAPPLEDKSLFEQQAREATDGHGEPIAEDPDETATDREPAVVGSRADQSGPGSDDTEGARLIALNMALNGTPREETDRYLAENFKLAGRDRLLDEVYASVGG
jgi:DivIVA domain-containing protein